MTTKTPPDNEASEDPFAEFAHWRKRDDWPEDESGLADEQKAIVAANAELLLDADRWWFMTYRFEAALKALGDDETRRIKRFQYEIRFDQHNFAGDPLNCRGFRFPTAVSFKNADFSGGNVSFFNAEFFGQTTDFSGAKFLTGDVDFRGAKFWSDFVLFNQTTFSGGDTDFFKAEFFEGRAYFAKTRFLSGLASFKEVSFSGTGVHFIGTEFICNLSAEDMLVGGDLYFHTISSGLCDLRRLRVDGTADFSGSTFTQVPDFRDAKLDRPPEVARIRVPVPKMTHRLVKGLPFDVVNMFEVAKVGSWSRADDVARYRKLKAMALAANDHEKDGEFFHYEMLAKRGIETKTFSGLLLNSLYWHLSDFGQSFTKPMIWLGISWYFFFVLCIGIVDFYVDLPNKLQRWEVLWFAAFNSLRNAVPLVGSFFRFAPHPEGEPGWFLDKYHALFHEGLSIDPLLCINVLQNLIGLVLLFLLALALRNRFRLK